jgi:hypothetical protein
MLNTFYIILNEAYLREVINSNAVCSGDAFISVYYKLNSVFVEDCLEAYRSYNFFVAAVPEWKFPLTFTALWSSEEFTRVAYICIGLLLLHALDRYHAKPHYHYYTIYGDYFSPTNACATVLIYFCSGTLFGER